MTTRLRSVWLAAALATAVAVAAVAVADPAAGALVGVLVVVLLSVATLDQVEEAAGRARTAGVTAAQRLRVDRTKRRAPMRRAWGRAWGGWSELWHRPGVAGAVLAGVVWMVLVAPIIWRMSHGVANGYLANDWIPHIREAAKLRFWPLHLPIPHFLFPLLAGIVSGLLGGVSTAAAGAVVGVVAAGATGAAIVWFLRRPWSKGGAPLPTGTAVVASIYFTLADLPQFLLFGFSGDAALRFDRINVSLHQWNTPTSVLAEALQIVMFVGLVSLGTEASPSRRRIAAVAASCAVCTFALPALPVAAMAAMPVWLWRSGRLRTHARVYVAAVAVPVVVALGIEALISETTMDVRLTSHPYLRLGGSLGSISWVGPGLGVVVPVVLVALVGWRGFVAEPAVRLVGWCLGVSLLLMATVAFDGPLENQGNTGRITYAVAWIGYLYMTRWVLESARTWRDGRTRRDGRTWSLRQRTAMLLVGAYVVVTLIGGLLMHLEQSGWIRFTGATI